MMGESIKDVKWVRVGRESREEFSITKSIDKDDLIKLLRARDIVPPPIWDGTEVGLSYVGVGDGEVFISLLSEISDSHEDHYTYSTDEYVFLESVRDDMDYVSEYDSEKKLMESIGRRISQEDFVDGER